MDRARGRRTWVGGCWVCFPRGYAGPGRAGDPAWSAAVTVCGGRLVDREVRTGAAGASYVPGRLALRIGPLLDEAVRTLSRSPDVLLVDATGRDHPRRAGLALQLGAELGLPTVGVTHRPLRAEGSGRPTTAGPPPRSGSGTRSSRAGCGRGRAPAPSSCTPAGGSISRRRSTWSLRSSSRRRTPEPLRHARHAARAARAAREETAVI